MKPIEQMDSDELVSELNRLGREQTKWSRRATISQNKLWDVRDRIDRVADAMSAKLKSKPARKLVLP